MSKNFLFWEKELNLFGTFALSVHAAGILIWTRFRFISAWLAQIEHPVLFCLLYDTQSHGKKEQVPRIHVIVGGEGLQGG